MLASPALRDGYCDTTGFGFGIGDCAADDKGSFSDKIANGDLATWEKATSACESLCALCARCNYVSVSVRWSDCSWFHACDFKQLKNDVKDHRSFRVSASRKQLLLASTSAPPPSLPQLPLHTRDRGVRLLGHPLALDGLFSRLHAGRPITMGVLGASVGQNGGCLSQPGKRCMGFRGVGDTPTGFAVRVLRHINRTFPGDHRIINAALDGTGAEHAAHCVVGHLPAALDLVIAEWGSMAMHTVRAMYSIERIARVLLSRPRPPVLLHLSVHEWCSQQATPRSLYEVGDLLKGSLKAWVYPDTPWAAVEEESTRVSRHYGQPSVSVHAALAPHVLARETRFALDDITGPDCLHPVNGRRGVQYVEALLTHWFERALALWHMVRSSRRDMLEPKRRAAMPTSMGLALGRAQPPKRVRRGGGDGGAGGGLLGLGAGVLPPPLHMRNADLRIHTQCYAFMRETTPSTRQTLMAPATWCSLNTRGATLADTCWAAKRDACPSSVEAIAMASLRQGSSQWSRAKAAQDEHAAFLRAPPSRWFYCGTSLGGTRRKISAGVVALVPGATLRVRIDGWNVADSPRAEIALQHLTSHEGMGAARLECVGECACEPQTVDAHRTNGIRNVSVFEDHRFEVRAIRATVRRQRQIGEALAWTCDVAITLLPQTRSGKHKFKVRAIEVVSALAGANATA